MAGRKQHYIPQLLLRGFGVAKARKVQVCVYPKGQEPFVTATDGIAAERYFYSEPAQLGEATLDDKITDHEERWLTGALASLREVPDDAAAPSLTAAKVTVHLAIRNAHVRETFAAASLRVVKGAVSNFRDVNWLTQAMGLDSDDPTERALDLIRETLREIPEAKLAPPQLLTAFEQTAYAALKAGLPEHFEQLQPLLDGFERKIADDLDDVIRRGHANALEKSLEPELRVQALSRLEWRVLRIGTPLILPDCVAGALIEGDERIIPLALVDQDMTVRAVYMPMSTDHLLVGSASAWPIVVPSALNNGLAAACSRFFIARERSPGLKALSRSIGDTTEAFLRPIIDEALDIDPRTVDLKRRK